MENFSSIGSAVMKELGSWQTNKQTWNWWYLDLEFHQTPIKDSYKKTKSSVYKLRRPLRGIWAVQVEEFFQMHK